MADSTQMALTVDEKIHLLSGFRREKDSRDGGLAGVERVGIPRLHCADGPLGVHWWTDAATAYPALITLAASFDETMAYRAGEAIGTDCRAVGVHILLSPGVNLYRSPLCGRNFEYMGEDPELAGQMAAAYIHGVQDCGVAATVKHLAANNQEYNRHWTSSDIDERTLREVYLRPFEIAVKEGQVGLVMTAYNLLNGQHCSEHKWLLQTVLRDDWGFEGLVISDWTSVYSTAQTLEAGLDLEMPIADYFTEEKIKPLLDAGIISDKTLDERVARRLWLMERFGWDNPSHRQKDESLPERLTETEAVALDIERNGIVLLKNEESFLPVAPEKVRRITLLGYHADRPVIAGGGSAYCPPHETVTLRQAIEKVYGDSVEINSFEMVNPWRGEQAWSRCEFRTSEGERGLQVEYYNNNSLEGEPVAVRTEEQVNFRVVKPCPEIDDGVFFSARWRGWFSAEQAEDFVFYMLSFGGVLDICIDGEWHQKADRGGPLWCALESGRHELEIVWRQVKGGRVGCCVGYEPARNAITDYEEGLASARESDLVVAAAGFVEFTERENYDRTFALDSRIEKMVIDAADVNANTVVALYSGGAVDPSAWIDRVKSVICLWYPGQNGTLAAAEMLAGQANPSGKLPFTWEFALEDRGSFSCYHDEDGDDRVAYLDGVFTGYRHFDRHGIAPRYPFGYGLSYTEFRYENLVVESRFDPEAGVNVQFDVMNTGDRAGAESALIFVADEEVSQPRPVRELKAFKKVHLEPGERKTVSVVLPPRAFAFWNMDCKQWSVEAGRFHVEVGPHAADRPLAGTVNAEQDLQLPC